MARGSLSRVVGGGGGGAEAGRQAREGGGLDGWIVAGRNLRCLDEE